MDENGKISEVKPVSLEEQVENLSARLNRTESALFALIQKMERHTHDLQGAACVPFSS